MESEEQVAVVILILQIFPEMSRPTKSSSSLRWVISGRRMNSKSFHLIHVNIPEVFILSSAQIPRLPNSVSFAVSILSSEDPSSSVGTVQREWIGLRSSSWDKLAGTLHSVVILLLISKEALRRQ